MDTLSKREKILNALQELLQTQNLNTISVSDIAQKAGIGKGSIYYYFSSKDAIVDALIEKNYKTPLETAKAMSDLGKPQENNAYRLHTFNIYDAYFIHQDDLRLTKDLVKVLNAFGKNIDVLEYEFLHQLIAIRYKKIGKYRCE